MAAVTHADSKSLLLHGKYASEFTRQLASSAPASTLHLPGIPATSAFLRLLTCHQMHGARRCKDQNTSHQHHPGTSSFQCKDIIVTESQHGNTWLNHRSGHPCGSNWHAHVAARTHGNTHTHTQHTPNKLARLSGQISLLSRSQESSPATLIATTRNIELQRSSKVLQKLTLDQPCF